MTVAKNRTWIFFAFSIGFILIDQWVKAYVRHAIPPHGALGGLPWPGVFEITLNYNEGIAFGLFQGAGVLLAPIAVAIAAASGWYSLKHPEESVVGHIAMGLLAAGALGNLIDRLVFHRVTDMFYFRPINFPVFNVADSCITVATVLLIFTWWKDAAKKEQAQKAQVAAAPREETENPA